MQFKNANVGITGASGFIGTHLIQSLIDNSINYKQLEVRYPLSNTPNLIGIHTIIHLAGLAHGKAKNELDSASVNRDFPIELAKISKKNGIKRFIFVSTVNVYAKANKGIIDETSKVLPSGHQASHKLEAENELLKLSGTDFSVLILRLPLVYSYDAPANFAALVNLSKKLTIQPFGLADAKKSFLSINNLTDAISKICLDTTGVTGTFNLTDGIDISTKDMLNAIRQGLGLKTYQINISPIFLRTLASLLRKEALVNTLFDECRISSDKFCKTFDWKPIEKPIEALVNLRVDNV